MPLRNRSVLRFSNGAFDVFNQRGQGIPLSTYLKDGPQRLARKTGTVSHLSDYTFVLPLVLMENENADLPSDT